MHKTKNSFYADTKESAERLKTSTLVHSRIRQN